MYLDDMLILGRTDEELSHKYMLAKSLLASLRFFVNEEKSVPGPAQEWEFLGFFNQLQDNGSFTTGPQSEIIDHSVQASDGVYMDYNPIVNMIWWRIYLKDWKSQNILPKKALLTLESDASNLGRGAVFLNQKTSMGGVWNSQETMLHINCKELFAAWLGLQCYALSLQDIHIHLRIDNTTAAVVYFHLLTLSARAVRLKWLVVCLSICLLSK